MSRIRILVESVLVILIVFLSRELVYYGYSFLALWRESGRGGLSLDFISSRQYVYDTISWALVLVLLLVLNRFAGQPFKKGFFIGRLAVKEGMVSVLWGFGLVFLVNGIANGLSLTIGTDFVGTYAPRRGSLLYIMLMPGLVLPVFEELVYRGFILSKLRGAFSATASIYLAALLFSMGHFDLVQDLYVLPLGLLAAYMVLRSGSIWSGVAIHAVFNVSNIYLYTTMPLDFNLPQLLVMVLLGVILIGFGLVQISQK